MEFLKNAATPQSLEHFHLIVLIAALNSMLLMTFLAFVLGSSVLSYIFGMEGRKTNNASMINLAKSIIDVAIYSKTTLAFLGIFPALSLLFVYAQMLQSTGAISVGLAGAGFISLITALTLLYSYKYTFRVEGLLERVEGGEGNTEVNEYRKSNRSVHLRSGRWGIFLLLLSIFLFSSAAGVTANPAHWAGVQSVIDVLVLPGVWVKFLTSLALSLGVTGSGLIFFLFAHNGGKTGLDVASRMLADSAATRFLVISMLALPLLVMLNLFAISAQAISGTVFLLAGLTVLFLFISAHFHYAYFKLREPRQAGYGLFLLLCAAAALMINDQLTIGNATREQAMLLGQRYERNTDELKSRLGVAMIAMTGAEIYDAKCSACHTFDQKKVGPPYNETLPKYKGDKARIISFVMNPAKIDPAYPPMPNQGLKPAEADSIVSYLLRKMIAGQK